MNPWIEKKLAQFILCQIRQKEQPHVTQAAINFNKRLEDTLMWKGLQLIPPLGFNSAPGLLAGFGQFVPVASG